jgi:hypothetical protein
VRSPFTKIGKGVGVFAAAFGVSSLLNKDATEVAEFRITLGRAVFALGDLRDYRASRAVEWIVFALNLAIALYMPCVRVRASRPIGY